MTGSIQEKNGKLYAVLSYKDKKGNHRKKWIGTGLSAHDNKRKAERMLEGIISENAGLEAQTEGVVFFTDYAEEWLEKKKVTVQRSTWEGYEIYLRRHILPYFEPLELTVQEVTPKHIKDYFENRLTAGRGDHLPGGLSMRSVRKMRPIFNQIFNEAIVDGLISSNPVTPVRLPKQEKPAPIGKFLTAEEANAVLEAFRGHELQPIVFVTLYYGLRRSEAVGLMWDAVDFERGLIKIQHTVVQISSTIEKDETKSYASRRTYPMLDEIRELLWNLREEQRKNRAAFGSVYNDSGYVFTWPDGTPFRPDSVTRGFQRVLANAGLPPIRFHDLRHSTASILFDQGWEMKDIQEWLGHAELSTTANIYTHISKLRREEMAKTFERTFHL